MKIKNTDVASCFLTARVDQTTSQQPLEVSPLLLTHVLKRETLILKYMAALVEHFPKDLKEVNEVNSL